MDNVETYRRNQREKVEHTNKILENIENKLNQFLNKNRNLSKQNFLSPQETNNETLFSSIPQEQQNFKNQSQAHQKKMNQNNNTTQNFANKNNNDAMNNIIINQQQLELDQEISNLKNRLNGFEKPIKDELRGIMNSSNNKEDLLMIINSHKTRNYNSPNFLEKENKRLMDEKSVLKVENCKLQDQLKQQKHKFSEELTEKVQEEKCRFQAKLQEQKQKYEDQIDSQSQSLEQCQKQIQKLNKEISRLKLENKVQQKLFGFNNKQQEKAQKKNQLEYTDHTNNYSDSEADEQKNNSKLLSNRSNNKNQKNRKENTDKENIPSNISQTSKSPLSRRSCSKNSQCSRSRSKSQNTQIVNKKNNNNNDDYCCCLGSNKKNIRENSNKIKKNKKQKSEKQLLKVQKKVRLNLQNIDQELSLTPRYRIKSENHQNFINEENITSLTTDSIHYLKPSLKKQPQTKINKQNTRAPSLQRSSTKNSQTLSRPRSQTTYRKFWY